MVAAWSLEIVDKGVRGDRCASLWRLGRKIAGVGSATYADTNTPAAVKYLAAPPQRSPHDRHHHHPGFHRFLQ